MKNNMTVRRGMTLKRKEALTGYLFILLPLISLMILMYYPILRSSSVFLTGMCLRIRNLSELKTIKH